MRIMDSNENDILTNVTCEDEVLFYQSFFAYNLNDSHFLRIGLKSHGRFKLH